MIRHFIGFMRALAKHRFRDKEALFWSIAFPCVFLIIFGAIMTGVQRTPDVGDASEMQKTTVGVYFETTISPSTQDQFIDLMQSMNLMPLVQPDADTLREVVQNHTQDIEFGVSLWGEDETLIMRVVLDARRENQMAYYHSISTTLHQRTQTKLSGFREILDVQMEEVRLTEQEATPLGFLLSGVLAISISMSGVASLIGSLGVMRKKRVLKRIIATPAQGSAFILADVVTTFVIAALSCILLLYLSGRIFGISFSIHPLYFPMAFIASTLIMIAFGGLFLIFFREPNVASGVVSVLTNIMIFFSGVYIPLEFLPDWLKNVASFLPMIHIARTMRFSLGHDLMPLGEYWGVVITFFALSCVWIPLIGWITFRGERR